jgi:hypothetical protein
MDTNNCIDEEEEPMNIQIALNLLDIKDSLSKGFVTTKIIRQWKNSIIS